MIFVAGILLGAWLMSSSGDADEVAQPRSGVPEAADVLAIPPDSNTAEDVLRDPEADFDRFQARIEGLAPAQRIAAIDAWMQRWDRRWSPVRHQVIALLEMGAEARAVGVLLDAAPLVRSLEDQRDFEVLLDRAVEQVSRSWVEAGRLADLDELLEQVTLTLPELPGYFLHLGTLRVQEGDVPGALAVLSQIQNDAVYGHEARMLLDDLTEGAAGRAAGVEQLGLIRRGDQFIVAAQIGTGRSLSLLVDTGASMTVVSERRMQHLGFVIEGPTAYFSTAGGVVEGPVMTVSALSLGKARVRQLSVGVLPVDFPDGIDGLLGMNFLRHFDFRIDQENARLELAPPSP